MYFSMSSGSATLRTVLPLADLSPAWSLSMSPGTERRCWGLHSQHDLMRVYLNNKAKDHAWNFFFVFIMINYFWSKFSCCVKFRIQGTLWTCRGRPHANRDVGNFCGVMQIKEADQLDRSESDLKGICCFNQRARRFAVKQTYCILTLAWGQRSNTGTI